MKKILVIVAVALLVLVVGGLSIYILFFQNRTPEVTNEEYVANVNEQGERGQLVPSLNSNYEWPPENGGAENGALPSAENYQAPETREVRLEIKRIIDGKSLAPTLTADATAILYFSPEIGEIFKTDLEGESLEAMTAAKLSDVYELAWSPTKDKAAITFSADSGAARKNIILNLNDQTVTELDSRLQSVVFSPNGEQIFYRFDDPGNDIKKLAVASTDGSDWNEVNAMPGAVAPVLDWYKDGKLTYYQQPSGYRQAQLYRVDPSGDNFEVLASGGFGISAKWSPNAARFAYIVYPRESSAMTLVAANDDLSYQREIQLATLLEKCAWGYDNVTLYCGVPKVINSWNVLPDDYLKEKLITKDTFYKINTDTGEITKIASSDDFGGSFDVYEPFMSTDNHRMFFTNRYDGKLYALIMP